jgi:hypothetical protein
MHIESVPNRKSHPTILLRESYRADGKVKKRTILNLTNWPEPLVEGLRTLLRGGVALATADKALTISRSLPHGHVAAVLGTAEQVGLPKLLSERRGGSASRRYRDLVLGAHRQPGDRSGLQAGDGSGAKSADRCVQPGGTAGIGRGG